MPFQNRFKMPDRKQLLTDRSITDLPPLEGIQYLARDTELARFCVRVGRRAKTFMLEGDLRVGGARETIRLKIGVAGRMKT